MIPDPKRLPILETERLRLQPLEPADAACIFPLMGDPEIMAFWEVPENDPDLVAAVVDGQVSAMAHGHAVHWAIRTLSDHTFIGCCDLSEIDRWHKRGELGFLLGRDALDQRFGLEATRAVVSYAAASGLRKLTARTQLGDRRAETLLAKLGFQQEGLSRGHILRDGDRRDCHLFGLLL